MRKIFLLFFVMLSIGITAYAQTRTITGRVVGKDDNQPLVGVTITVKGSNTATATDVDGKFSIKTNNLENVTIGAKFIGYQYQEITLKAGEMKVNFSLVATNSSLNEVVVTGYGTTVKSKLLGPVAEIKAADVEDLPVANLGTALKDRLPGVSVNVASGKPGSPTTIAIRNPTSFGATLGLTSNPLYVIDGLISTIDDFNNLDASLVESISFLKDSQAAIYGAAGDKGVVLVTTKKGKPGKAKINYTGYFGTSTNAVRPKVLSAVQLAQLLNDNWDLNNTPYSSRFSQADLDYLATDPVPDWYSQMWHASNTNRHTINVSGGTEKVTFFGGASYYDEGGNYGTVSIKKYNIRSGMTAKVTDDLTAYISLNTNYSKDWRNFFKTSNTGTEDITTRAVFLTPGWVPLQINGNPIDWIGPNAPGEWNPLALFNSGDYETNANQVINLNSSLEYRPSFIKGLTAKVQFGKNNGSGTLKQYWPPYTVYNYQRSGNNNLLWNPNNIFVSTKQLSNTNRLNQGASTSDSYELIGSLDYARTINKHTFDILVLTDQTESSSNTYQNYRDTQQIPGVDEFFAFTALTNTIGPSPTESGKRSFLGRFNYDYAGKYLLQFIGRVDGSANFPPDKRWGFFPSVALGWRVSEEKWFKDNLSKYINSFKLRANVGLVGDDRIQGYQYIARFTQTTGYLFGTTVSNGLDPNLYPNPNVTWEKARTQNYGFDATFLNDKLSLTVDFWNRHTYDAFQDFGATSYPATVGIASGVFNYAIQNDWGTEFNIGYNSRINKDWSWNANVEFAFSNSQVIQQNYTALNLGMDEAYLNGITAGLDTKRYTSSNIGLIAKGIIRTQAQLDAILAKNPNYLIEGVKPQLGFMDYEDVNGDGKITKDADMVPMYSRIDPSVVMGLTYGMSYKQLKFSINGRLALGGKVFVDGNAKKAPSSILNGPAFWADHWTPSNPDATYPRSDAPDIDQNSTFWARSGTTLYINNASLSYSLPKSITDRLKIPDFRILVSGTNLWSIINPFDYKDSRQSTIYDYPTLRTISVGVNISL